MTTRQVGRRDAAAGGLAMLVLAAAAAGSAKAAELDGELLALCQEFHASEDELDGLFGDYDMRIAGDPRIDRERELIDRRFEIREELVTLTPRTPEGFAAKARVILADFSGEDNPNYPGQYDPRTALAMSLAKDILRRTT